MILPEIIESTLEARLAIWRPTRGPQERAFNSKCFEVLYGGAAGSGKTDLLLGLARLRHKSSLLLRRTFPQLEDTLIIRSLQLFGNSGDYNRSKHVWEFPDGCRIRFGHLENDKDVYQYQSAEFDLIGFDELTQFSRWQYEYLLSRARTTSRVQLVQVVSCTNPGGDGNDWVMERWAPWINQNYHMPAQPYEVRYFVRDDDGNERETNDRITGKSRTFIPARLGDNPYLGEDYKYTLSLLPEPLRSQLLHGDWRAGQIDDPYQLIPRDWVLSAVDRWRNREQPTTSISAVGVDCARGGDDKHVMAERRGNWFAELRKYPGSIVKTGQDALNLLRDIAIGNAPVNIDVIGIGSSVYDFARESYNAVAVNVAESADKQATDRSGKFGFVNKRAQYYWKLREALDPENGENLALPDDPELIFDMCSMRYSVQSNGIKIEAKDAIIRRRGKSPDCAEAVMLAFVEQEETFVPMTITDDVSAEDIDRMSGVF